MKTSKEDFIMVFESFIHYHLLAEYYKRKYFENKDLIQYQYDYEHLFYEHRNCRNHDAWILGINKDMFGVL